jgi:hypothetical protein
MFAVTTQSGRWNQIEIGVMEKTAWRMQSELRKKHAASDSAEFQALCFSLESQPDRPKQRGF